MGKAYGDDRGGYSIEKMLQSICKYLGVCYRSQFYYKSLLDRGKTNGIHL